MPVRDYYVVLGVSRTGSAEQIRSAYRALVRRYHPDRAGSRSARQFREIVDAYQVLSDAERRAAYDRGLQHVDAGAPFRSGPVTPVAPNRGPRPEPLVPQHDRRMRGIEVTAPSNDWLFDRFVAGSDITTDRPRPMRALPLEVRLPAIEAMRGGALTFHVPVFYPCRTCRGSGWRAGRPCRMCGGGGLREEEEPVRVNIPPGVADGSTLYAPVRGLGVCDLFLEIRVRIVRAG